MKPMLKFWAAVAGALIIIWGLLRLYDIALTNGDGLLGGINLDVLLGYLLGSAGLLAAVMLGTRSRYGWLANVSASLCGLLFFWTVAEVVCFGLIGTGLSDAPRPFHSRVWLNENWCAERPSFWGDVSPDFGRWRVPDASIRLPLCTSDTITLRSNRFGMRDPERTLANGTGRSRALFLGDSFVEGFLVNAPQRYSNLLEARTGREHLNFGINGTSLIDYYLIYEKLARRFEHDVVIVSLLPANDFEGYEESQKLELLRYPIYRPYWQGKHPDVRLAYSLADISQSIAAPVNYRKPEKVQQTVDSLYRSLPWGKKVLADIQLNSYLYGCAMFWAGRSVSRSPALVNSFAAETFDSRWPTLAHSLEKLLKAAQGKQVIVLAVPTLTDLKAYDQQPKDDLSPRLRELCRRSGAAYVNLLPGFHEQGAGAWPGLYVPCDGHFTPEGERLVAEILLARPEYRRAMGLARP